MYVYVYINIYGVVLGGLFTLRFLWTYSSGASRASLAHHSSPSTYSTSIYIHTHTCVCVCVCVCAVSFDIC